MTSLLIPSAVAMLAHKRISDAVELLERKVVATDFYDLRAGGLAPPVINVTERRVLAAAQAVKAMFEAGPRAVPMPLGLQVGQGIGSFVFLGSAAYELPGYADVLAPGGAWTADALRRGTPDPNLSHVVVGSTQFAVRAGEIGIGKTAVADEQGRIQAFTMGMLSAAATGIVVGPVLRGLQARRTARDWSRHEPAVDIAAAEARILGELLGGGFAPALWQGWWPATADIPTALFDGYVDALEEAYRLSAARDLGFADFRDGFDAGDPMTTERLRHAYALLRQDAATSAWGAGIWYLVLLPALVAPATALLVARVLPAGRALVLPGPAATERSVFEVLTVSMGFGALAPFGYSMYMWSQIAEHVDAFVNALVLFLARAGLIATVAGTSVVPVSAGVRWGLLFPLLAGTDVYALVRGIVAKVSGRPGDAFVFLLQLSSIATGALVLGWAALIKAMGATPAAYWIMWALLLAVPLALGIPLAIALSKTGGFRSWFLRERLESFPLLDAMRGVPGGNPAALAHVFDDSTLWHDPARAAAALTDLRYPAGRRVLVRIWWTGDGGLQVRHSGHTLTFIKDDASTKVVDLGPPGITAPALATRLVNEVEFLQAEPVGVNDPAYRLPFPQTYDDPGDTLGTLAEHDQRRDDPVPVGTSRDDAFLLRHTPRGKLTSTYGVFGATASPLEGIPLVPGRTLADLDESALGLAADLAVLLGLGAAPSLSTAPITAPVANPNMGPVFQVFRQWNLDERRINEWRMLVQGGAVSEKGGAPGARDPAMRPNPVAAAPPYASPAAGGEPLATAMGWIPLWRAWLRMASDVTADSDSATTAMPYTPTVATRDGQTVQPANGQLTTAIRFLLDLNP